MPFDFDPKNTDKSLLEQFLKDASDLLNQIIISPGPRDVSLAFIGNSQTDLQRIFEDEMPSKFESAIRAVQNARDNRLSDAGLAGRSLRAKLHVLHEWYQEFTSHPQRPTLKRILDILNSLFGSLVAATGAGEAIKEIKELIENAVKSWI